MELSFSKLASIFRWLMSRSRYKKSELINFKERYVFLSNKNKISIGKRNVFKAGSKIIADCITTKDLITIGDSNTVSYDAILKSHGGHLKIGSNNFIGERVQIQGLGGVEIGSNCMIAANTFVSSSNHNINTPSSTSYLLKEVGKKTTIGNKVWIGANCTIVAGVDIGDYSVIAAGAVVTKSVSPYSMVAGIPARVIKRYCKNENKWLPISKC